ncbi:MAG TPA: 2-oxo acid dehydrogenase subunit E2, partial [Caulobacteraceae bacterium]|nr:2-oxo acid dehydrogenase subunit E2 [Caulobacteraceae bacterium]
MADIMTPALGESVTEATVARWTKKQGEAVKKDEILVELETDKVSLEVASPADGVLAEVAAGDGETVTPGALLGRVTEGATAAAPTATPPQPKDPPKAPPETATDVAPAGEAQPGAEPGKAPPKDGPLPDMTADDDAKSQGKPLSPSVQRIVSETGLDPKSVEGSGKGGRITKGDALAALDARASQPAQAPAPAEARPVHEREERVRMSRLRQTIARRLKEAQNTAAMLTTFNEVDMSAVMGLRSEYRDLFEKKHGVKLGFMGFFVKASVQALREMPEVNAEIDGSDIIYKNYYHIGVAVGTEKGLVVPVVRDCDIKSLAEIEKAIADFGRRAR